MAKSYLESQGIPAFVRDQHIVGINWFYSNVVGGVRLEVFHRDYVRAKNALQKVESEKPASRGEKPSQGLTSYRTLFVVVVFVCAALVLLIGR